MAFNSRMESAAMSGRWTLALQQVLPPSMGYQRVLSNTTALLASPFWSRNTSHLYWVPVWGM